MGVQNFKLPGCLNVPDPDDVIVSSTEKQALVVHEAVNPASMTNKLLLVAILNVK